ncbi:MAG: hypothetical protein WCC65_12595 [Pseudonocardiaceae bacterium]
MLINRTAHDAAPYGLSGLLAADDVLRDPDPAVEQALENEPEQAADQAFEC